MQRKIIHIDMDCFFAAIEERDNPALRGIPMAVGGSPGKRGVLCTANYAARVFGVRSAMASGYAMKLCPHLRILPVRIGCYREESARIFEVLAAYTDLVQPISLDEAFLDVSECSQLHGSATLIAADIKRRIRQTTGLTASAGVAPNKFLAKIASDWRKPDGLFVITPDDVDAFTADLPVEKIWGVGKVTAERLHRLGCRTCGDIRSLPLVDLVRQFGAFGHSLRELAHGRDDRPVAIDDTRKSLSVENTYVEDLSHEECPAHIRHLRSEMLERLQEFLQDHPDHSIKGATVKIKFSDFRSTTIDCTDTNLGEATFLALLRDGLTRSELPVRLLGCGVRFHDIHDAGPRQLDFLPLLYAPNPPP